ncbi:cyclic nucleotide-binding domain-containing protein [Legionella waltersii]|uniref:Cyclic nucleotide-binding protein n=1 Tax=Legionella waltersii TaxID=66969 RepID=A0A0W1A787_9GAMM|nr:cyclic nucleotide-binding domain-containing protein [Legionella waltersii]KTD77160.1 cyclic nucleotide-binding protein [Legionella waltersii]SNV11390.1 cyclic nucleotide-binding protein [Legionella waltersii]
MDKKNLSIKDRESLIEQYPLFSLLNPDEIHQLALITVEQFYEPGTRIVKKGDVIDSVYLIVSGIAAVVENVQEENRALTIATLKEGDGISLNATGFFTENGIRSADVIAKTAMTLLKIDVLHFNDFLNRSRPNSSVSSMKNVNEKFLLMNFMKSMHLLHCLTNSDIREVAHKVRRCTFQTGEMLCRERDPAAAIFFLISGEVSIHSDDHSSQKQSRTVKAPAMLGEPTYLQDGVCMVSVIANNTCDCFMITKDEMLKWMTFDKQRNELLRLSRIEELVYEPISDVVESKTNDSRKHFVALYHKQLKKHVSISQEQFKIWNEINGQKNIKTIQQKTQSIGLMGIYKFLESMRAKGFAKLVTFELYRPRNEHSILTRLVHQLKNLFRQDFRKAPRSRQQ